MPSVKYSSVSIYEIYDQLTDFIFDKSEFDHRVMLMQGIMLKFQENYPTEFQEAFEGQPETVAPVLQNVVKSIEPKIPARNPQLIEDVNFEKLGIMGKQKKTVTEDKKSWVFKNL
jgi:hypothetical protein